MADKQPATVEIPTNALDDTALVWAVAKALGYTINSYRNGDIMVLVGGMRASRIIWFDPMHNWHQLGDIIKREGLCLWQNVIKTESAAYYREMDSDKEKWVYGRTPEVALLRAVVKHYMGDMAAIPVEIAPKPEKYL